MTSAESKSELFTVATGDSLENQPKKLSFYEHYIQPCLAEVLGSTLFMFVGCVSVMGNVGISGSIQPALAHGLALAIAIAIFGEIRYLLYVLCAWFSKWLDFEIENTN